MSRALPRRRDALTGAGDQKSPGSEGPGAREIALIRHAETQWSRDGRHTGRTDLPLTERGRRAAVEIGRTLADRDFAAVLASPLRRARETCELCGLGEQAQVRAALAEWDYGEYEGLTTAEIRQRRPGWSLWRDGCPGGEDAERVGARAREILAELQGVEGDVAVFSHGHMLRVLAACWIELEPAAGARLALCTGALSALGREHGERALLRWNVSASGTDRASVLQ